jgi:hypothetical protein
MSYVLSLLYEDPTSLFSSAYMHIKDDGAVVWGGLTRIECDATITIFCPLDEDDHRLVVIPEGYHIHYLPQQTKVSMPGKLTYKKAAETFVKHSITPITPGQLAQGKQFFFSSTWKLTHFF